MPSPRARELERAPRDALDRLGRVLARVERRAVRTPAAGAVVEAADELADDQQVDARPGGGTQVRVDVERPAERDQALLRPHRRAFELRQADRAEDDRVGRLARSQRPSGSGVALREDRAAAEAVLLDLDLERERAEDVDRDRRHLGPDSVSGQAGDAQHQRPSSCFVSESRTPWKSSSPACESGPSFASSSCCSSRRSRSGSACGTPLRPSRARSRRPARAGG